MIAQPSDRTQPTDLTVLLDQLAAVAPNFCERQSNDSDAAVFWLADDTTALTIKIPCEYPDNPFDAAVKMIKRQFRSHNLPLTIEYPMQWDIVSVRSGKFQALCSEEAMALLFVLVACLEAMEGQAE